MICGGCGCGVETGTNTGGAGGAGGVGGVGVGVGGGAKMLTIKARVCGLGAFGPDRTWISN